MEHALYIIKKTCTYIIHAYIRKYIHYVHTYIHTHTHKQVLKTHTENAINIYYHICTTVTWVPNLVKHYMYGDSTMTSDRPQRSPKFERLTYRD